MIYKNILTISIHSIKFNKNSIDWSYKYPIKDIRDNQSSRLLYLILAPLLSLTTIILISQFNLQLIILNIFIHILLYKLCFHFFREYHKYNINRRITRKIDPNTVNNSEGKIIEIAKNYRKHAILFILPIYFISSALIIFLLNIPDSMKAKFTLIFLIPIYLAFNIMVFNEKINYYGITKIDYDREIINIRGRLNHEFNELIEFKDIHSILFVDSSPLGQYWSVFSIVVTTPKYRIPAGNFYSEIYNKEFDELYNFFINQPLNKITTIKKMSFAEYKENVHSKRSIRLFS